MSSNETTLYFVRVDESDGKYLQVAFENAKSRELDVEFMSGKELLKNGVGENQTIFVTDKFTGDIFELLLAHKKRIFGSICVLQCLNNCIPLPNSVHPVYCLAMSGAIVACTTIAKPLREKLKQLIERMNGVFLRDLTGEVTHLVAGEVGSAKYATAAALNKPIVLPSWVEDAWQKMDTEYQLDGTDLKFVDKHRCPIFKGCSICVSGLNGGRKDEIKRLVEEHGGMYSPELKLKGTTHLLIEKPTGRKFPFALRWSVRCVQPDWLYDCINAGSWIEESPYLVKQDNDNNSTGESNASLSTTTVDATINHTSLGSNASRKAAEAAMKSAESYGSKDRINNVRQLSLTRIKTFGLKSLRKSKDRTRKHGATTEKDLNCNDGKYTNNEHEEIPENNNMDVTDLERIETDMKHTRKSKGSDVEQSTGILHGLNFCLDGFAEEQVMQLQEDIENYGGNILSNQSKTIADFLVVPLNYECGEKRAKNVVTYCWLECCVESGKILEPSDEFLFSPFSVPDEVFPLQDCVISVSQYADVHREHLMHLIEILGGHFQEYFTRVAKTNVFANTHLIVEEPRGSKYEAAVNWNIPAVSAKWLYECARSGDKVLETPYTLSSKKSPTEKGESRAERDQAGVENKYKEDTNNVLNDFSAPQNVKETGDESEAPLNRKTKDKDVALKEQPISMKRRRSSRLHNSRNSGHSGNSSEFSNPRRQSSRVRSRRPSEDNSHDDGDNGRTLEVEIIDGDPKSRHDRQKIIAQLEDCSPSVHKEPGFKNIADKQVQMNKSTNNDASSHLPLGQTIKKESLSPTSPIHFSTPTAPPALHITSKSTLPEPAGLLDFAEEPANVVEKPRPKFILSALSQQEKTDYGALIEELGGVMFDNPVFNPASRHTIAGQLMRNEKCLSSIAAGNWLLRKSYLEECRKTGYFVDEEAHEWGVPIPGESLSSLAVASRRWRNELAKKSARANKKIGAFHDWKVLLCVKEGKAGSFTRMLEAGGAKVLGTVPPFQNIAHVTHAFIGPSAALVSNIDFNRLQLAEILVLRTDYIVDYLTAGNKAPDTSKYFYQPSNVESSRKRKQRESGLPETPGKKKRGD